MSRLCSPISPATKPLPGSRRKSPTTDKPRRRRSAWRLAGWSKQRWNAAAPRQISHALRAVAVDAIASPVAADRVVLHLVLLLKIDALGEVDRCLETLDAAYGARLCFRCVGPMPPANFATLEIERLESD